jgi:hypothetical protein
VTNLQHCPSFEGRVWAPVKTKSHKFASEHPFLAVWYSYYPCGPINSHPGALHIMTSRRSSQSSVLWHFGLLRYICECLGCVLISPTILLTVPSSPQRCNCFRLDIQPLRGYYVCVCICYILHYHHRSVCLIFQIPTTSDHAAVHRGRSPFHSVHYPSYLHFYIRLTYWGVLIPPLYPATPFATDPRGWGSRVGTRDQGKISVFSPRAQGAISWK